MQKSDISRPDFCLDHEGIIERDNFHDGFTGADHSADRRQLELLDRTTHRRAHIGTCDPVFASRHHFTQRLHFTPTPVQFIEGLGTKLRFTLNYAPVCLFRCLTDTWDAESQRIDIAFQRGYIALHSKEVGSRIDPLVNQRLGDIALLLCQCQAALQLTFSALHFNNLLPPLAILRLQHIQFGIKLRHPGPEDRRLFTQDLRVVRLQSFRKDQFIFKFSFCSQPDDGGFMFLGLGKGVPELTGSDSIVNARQDVTLLNNLVFLHQDILKNAPLQVLDQLDPLRRDDLAHAPGHFIKHSIMRPQAKQDQQDSHRHAQQIGERMAFALDRCIDLAHKEKIFFRSEQTQQPPTLFR